MFKRILIPTDLQEKSRRALDLAVQLAVREQGHLFLLHVIETLDDAEEDAFKTFYERLSKRAAKAMNDMAGLYADRPVHIDPHIVFGKRVREIVRFAHERRVDLILLGSHKIDPSNPAEGWATISYRVAILAPCHVMMVK